jgi:FkbM family methyltransferase
VVLESRPEYTDKHPLFSISIVLCDLLQRVFMRLWGYVWPVKDCRTVFGAVIRCRSRDYVQRRIRFFGVFEHNLTYYTMDRLREGDIYLDIGANIGYFTLLASRCVGDAGKVIAVEADPATFAALKDNLERNGCHNVVPCNVAATAKVCKVTIEPGHAHNSGSNRIVVGQGTGTIDGLPLRDIAGGDLSRVRFIKIDIEGSEEPVLREMLGLLPELPEDLIIAAEISPASAGYVARFVAAGFRSYAIQNVYAIDYYLIRSYLRRFHEDQSVHVIPVERHDLRYSDYIFERGGPVASLNGRRGYAKDSSD